MHTEFLDDLILRYSSLEPVRQDILNVFNRLAECFRSKGSLYICGNGGSASDALHLVGELMKSFAVNRGADDAFRADFARMFPDDTYVLDRVQGALPAYALVENISLSTACANDTDAEMIFAQQVYGYTETNDVVLAISTLGNSKNLINAVKVARAKNVATMGLLGGDGGILKTLCDYSIVVPGTEPYKVQELHLPVYHTIALMLEREFFCS